MCTCNSFRLPKHNADCPILCFFAYPINVQNTLTSVVYPLIKIRFDINTELHTAPPFFSLNSDTVCASRAPLLLQRIRETSSMMNLDTFYITKKPHVLFFWKCHKIHLTSRLNSCSPKPILAFGYCCLRLFVSTRLCVRVCCVWSNH